MTRTRACVGAIAVVGAGAVAAALPTGASSTASPRRCPPSHARPIAAQGRARLFRQSPFYEACLVGGPVFVLGPGPYSQNLSSCSGDALFHVRLSAGDAAWYDQYECHAQTDTLVGRRDLRTGRVLTLTTGADSPYGRGVGPAVALVLGANGDLAWIASVAAGKDAPFEGGPPYQVWKYDRGGKRRVDAGPQIEPRTLRLTATGFRWRNHGQTRSKRFE